MIWKYRRNMEGRGKYGDIVEIWWHDVDKETASRFEGTLEIWMQGRDIEVRWRNRERNGLRNQR